MSIRRREFLGLLSVGSASLGWPSKIEERAEEPAENEREEEVIAYYPGARLLRGPWRLRLDPEDAGKSQQWYMREPSDQVSKACEAFVPGCWQEYIPNWDGGVGWYFKQFELSNDLSGQVLRLKFWAVGYFAEVWLNGEMLGSHGRRVHTFLSWK